MTGNERHAYKTTIYKYCYHMHIFRIDFIVKMDHALLIVCTVFIVSNDSLSTTIWHTFKIHSQYLLSFV